MKHRLIGLLAVAAFAAAALAPVAVTAAGPVGGGVPGDPIRVVDGDTSLGQWAISPDGATLVYGDRSTKQIFAKPTTGGDAMALSPVLQDPWPRILISPNGDHVVYIGEAERGAFELFSVPIGGGTVSNLSQATLDKPRILPQRFAFTPDGTKVLFVGETHTAGALELYVADVAGGSPPTKLHDDFLEGGIIDSMKLTPDGSRVVFTADSGHDTRRLYTSRIDNGQMTELSPRPLRSVGGFVLTNDGTQVLWSGKISRDRGHLFVVPITGGPSTRLSGSVVLGGTVGGIAPTGDDEYVAYTADHDTDDVFEAYVVRIDGSSRRKLNPALPEGGDIDRLMASPIDQTIVYRADQDINDVHNYYSVNAGGGDAVQLNPPLTGTDLWSPRFTPDGSKVVFFAHTGPRGTARLYAAEPDGSELAWISQGAGPFSDIRPDVMRLPENVRITADSEHVIFAAVPEGESAANMYSSRVDGSQTILLGAATTVNGPWLYQTNPEGTHAGWDDDGIYVASVRNRTCDGRRATHIGTPGRDTIVGTRSADVIVGLGGVDNLNGFGGNDRICGNRGKDTIIGGSGNDAIVGGPGNDTLHGSKGDDRLRGGSGHDHIFGGSGTDTIVGHSGNDDLHGGPDSDTCDGGPGTDTAESCQAVNVP